MSSNDEIRREDERFAEILVLHKFARAEQVREALALQAAQAAVGAAPRLGELLLRAGALSFETLERALALHRQSPSSKSLPGSGFPLEVARASADPKCVLGKYVLVNVLGRGGMGVVYRAYDTSLKRYVALKVPTLASEEDMKRFQREAQTAAALEHPNIAAIHEIDCVNGQFLIAMELINGSPSYELKLSVPAALRITGETARAIQHAHAQGVIHRDIKPGNILVDAEGHAHVLDFGLARPLKGGERLTLSGTIVGTPSYMAPEQADVARGPVGPHSDVYGLGSTLYHLLTGKPPFAGDNPMQILRRVVEEEPRPPRSLNPLVPPEAEAICLTAMDREPRKRYGSAAEMADDIDRYLAGTPIRARRRSIATRLFRQAHRTKQTLAIVGVTALLLAVAGAGIFLAMESDRDSRTRALMAQGDRLFQMEDYAGAFAEYSKARVLAPDDARLRRKLADCRVHIERIGQEKLNEERRAKEEAEARASAEMKRAEEERRKAEEARLAAEAEARRLEEERRRSEEARRAAEAEAQRAVEERRKAEEARRAAEEARRQEEARRRAEEEARPRPPSLGPRRREAQAAFDSGTKRIDEAVRNLYRKGADLSKNREFLQEAVKSLAEAVRLDPGFHEAFHARGRARQLLGQWAESEEDYSQALKILPGYAAALRSRAFLRLERSQEWLFDRGWSSAMTAEDPFIPRALEDLRKLRGALKDEIDSAFVEAVIAYSQRNTAETIRICGVITAKNDALEEVLKLRADAQHWEYLVKKSAADAENADRDYTRALELCVNYISAYKMRAALRLKLGRTREAEADLNAALRINPKDPSILMTLGIQATHEERWAEAADLLTRSIDLGEEAVFAFNARGVAYLNLKKYDEAIKDFDRALKLYPDNPMALYNRGLCHYQRKEMIEARRDLQRLCQLDPRYSQNPTVRAVLDGRR
jgi:tetratricopeptide (TPR) repeat protein